jgi:hypothetical protein
MPRPTRAPPAVVDSPARSPTGASRRHQWLCDIEPSVFNHSLSPAERRSAAVHEGRRRPPTPSPPLFEIWRLPSISAGGEHLYSVPSTSSFNSTPRPSSRIPWSPVIRPDMAAGLPYPSNRRWKKRMPFLHIGPWEIL